MLEDASWLVIPAETTAELARIVVARSRLVRQHPLGYSLEILHDDVDEQPRPRAVDREIRVTLERLRAAWIDDHHGLIHQFISQAIGGSDETATVASL